MIYCKRYTGKLLPQKMAEQSNWVQWTHHSEGKTHCATCLMLDGCFFTASNHPPCPHHPFCHCTLEPVDYAVVLINTSAYSDYRKFEPYLFNTTGLQTHNKEKLFKEWGYTVEDARWLQAEIERQARERYISGQYELGKLKYIWTKNQYQRNYSKETRLWRCFFCYRLDGKTQRADKTEYAIRR